MKMILISIILYITFNLILEIKKKKTLEIDKFDFRDLKLKSFSLKTSANFLIVFSFCIWYIVFLKILRLLKDSKYIDLNLMKQKILQLSSQYNLNYSYILIIIIVYLILLRSLRNLIIFFFKLKILSLNYLFLFKNNNYFIFFSKLTIWHIRLWFYVMGREPTKKKKLLIICIEYFFKYIGYMFLILGFVFDLIFNNYVLIYFSTILPWFSFYQMLYRSQKFLATSIDIDLEDLVANSIYIKELHDRKLRLEYAKIKKKYIGGYALYKNISINMLGDVPLKIPPESELIMNNYVKSLLE